MAVTDGNRADALVESSRDRHFRLGVELLDQRLEVKSDLNVADEQFDPIVRVTGSAEQAGRRVALGEVKLVSNDRDSFRGVEFVLITLIFSVRVPLQYRKSVGDFRTTCRTSGPEDVVDEVAHQASD